MYKPIILIILDGWGLGNPNNDGNAIAKADLPTFDKLDKYYPLLSLQASGISVGIPWNEPGNSEVGHTIIGAGRIVYQNLPKIDLAIQDGSFFTNKALLSGIENVKEKNSSLHLMGLISEGSVHSNYDHLIALLELARDQKIKKVFLHLFTDGRDSQPTFGVDILKKLQKNIKDIGVGKIDSIHGRSWAMDRNNNWDRIKKSYQVMTEGVGKKFDDPIEYLQSSYEKGVYDEYIEPAINSSIDGLIKDNDSVIFFNFREDRARQLTKAFVIPGLKKARDKKRLNVKFITMIEYEKDLPVSIVFPPTKIKNGLGKTLSDYNKKQLRIAETEKYAHVTYFFNGGEEKPFTNEDRILIPSPSVAKYDQSPEMSADAITEKIITAVKEESYDFILVNYANADMVGHTGNEKAIIQAVECLDKQMAKLIPIVLSANGCLLITADHGNAEKIKDPYSGQLLTEHSDNPVPLWFITPNNHKEKTLEEINITKSKITGLLSDIAPTILNLMQIKKPAEMTGESLLPLLQEQSNLIDNEIPSHC